MTKQPPSGGALDGDALAHALQTIDDDADPAHADITPAVRALGAIGLPAVPGILDLMMADDPMTRLHAQRALEAVLDARHGFVSGRGFPSPAHEAARLAEWQSHGAYKYDAPEVARAAAVASWRAWLATSP